MIHPKLAFFLLVLCPNLAFSVDIDLCPKRIFLENGSYSKFQTPEEGLQDILKRFAFWNSIDQILNGNEDEKSPKVGATAEVLDKFSISLRLVRSHEEKSICEYDGQGAGQRVHFQRKDGTLIDEGVPARHAFLARAILFTTENNDIDLKVFTNYQPSKAFNPATQVSSNTEFPEELVESYYLAYHVNELDLTKGPGSIQSLEGKSTQHHSDGLVNYSLQTGEFTVKAITL